MPGVAPLGGALADGDPHMELPPVLMALGSTLQRALAVEVESGVDADGIQPHHNLVELLQIQFSLTGARESCGEGLCGCCTVFVDGRAISTAPRSQREPRERPSARPGPACVRGRRRIPVRVLHARFRHHDTKLLEQYQDPDKDTIKHYPAVNLCRCATYPEVQDAARLAVDIGKARKPSYGRTCRIW
jgi:aerobic carbon-monoxide dehydrogenase small subunit